MFVRKKSCQNEKNCNENVKIKGCHSQKCVFSNDT